MSRKTPDTRNRLDNTRNSKAKPIKFKPKNSLESFKQLKKIVDPPPPLKIKGEKKPTKGELFKKAMGYSKTVKRNMNKRNVSTVEELKSLRKTRKRSETKMRQKKHSDSVLYKRTHIRDKKTNKKKKK